jgi:hypothetical protein
MIDQNSSGDVGERLPATESKKGLALETTVRETSDRPSSILVVLLVDQTRLDRPLAQLGRLV